MGYVVLINIAEWPNYFRASADREENFGAGELARQLLTQIVPRELARSDAACQSLGSTAHQAWILSPTPEAGRAIISGVTRWAVEHAPGMDVTGVVGTVAVDRAGPPTELQSACQDAESAMHPLRMQLPSAMARFQRRPVVERCESTGLPASGVTDLQSPRSAMALAMRRAAQEARAYWHRVLSDVHSEVRIAPREFTTDNAYAIIHVHSGPSNLGAVFANSVLPHAGLQALAAATRDGSPEWIMPLVVRGSDMLLACDARGCLPFAARYLKACWLAMPEIEGAPQSAYAGVAIVDGGTPLHISAALAEQLCAGTVGAGSQCGDERLAYSALDFCVVNDSRTTNLWHDRRRQVLSEDTAVPEQNRLFGGPYVICAQEARTPARRRWFALHQWSHLERGVTAVRDLLSNGQSRTWASLLYELRDAVHLGRHEAHARLRVLLRNRPDAQMLQDILLPARSATLGNGRATSRPSATRGRLFAMDNETVEYQTTTRHYVCTLPDILEAAAIW